MKKIGLGILIGVVGVVLTVSVASALPEKAKIASPTINNEGDVVAPPEEDIVAPPEFAPVPFPQLPESELTKIVFIRYAPGLEPICDGDHVCDPKENWKNCPGDCPKGGEEPTPTACYAFLSGGKPKWNLVEPYVYNDLSLEGPSANAVNTWEAPVSGDIFGVGSYATGYDWGKYDYTNSATYGDYDDTGKCLTSEPCVIAVTAIWFRAKNIYEYDIMFDRDFFPETGVWAYDLPTVTLHEFGHGAGLNDLYDTACSGNVMYGYYHGVDLDLGPGDATGIQTLYGI